MSYLDLSRFAGWEKWARASGSRVNLMWDNHCGECHTTIELELKVGQAGTCDRQ